ncbi:MAG: DUF4407 domain-containing protein, partial [Bacteroidota bacterium]
PAGYRCPCEHGHVAPFPLLVSGLTALSIGWATWLATKLFVVSLIAGLFLGWVIYIIYRYIVLSFRHRIGFGKGREARFGQALPRLILVSIIGFCIAKPLELMLFQRWLATGEIEFQAAHQAYRDSLLDDQFGEIAQWQARLAAEDSIWALRMASPVPPDSAEGVAHTADRKALLAQIDELAAEKADARDRYRDAGQAFGLLAQLKWLQSHVPIAWGITITIWLIFTLPVFNIQAILRPTVASIGVLVLFVAVMYIAFLIFYLIWYLGYADQMTFLEFFRGS